MHDFATTSNGAHLATAGDLAVAGREPCQHLVQFYETDSFLAEAVGRFIGDGVRSGEPAVIIATRPHREAFTKHLLANDIPVPRAIRDGRLVMLDAEETLRLFVVGGAPDWRRFEQSVGQVLERLAHTSPGRSIRAYGEMVDVLWRAGQQGAAIVLEEMWNDLRGHHEFELLCAYVVDSFYKQNGISEICATHSHVLPPERSGGKCAPDTVQSLIAEIGQRTELERALRSHVRRLHQAEREASASKEDLEDFLANAPVAIHRVDKDGIIRWANRAELEMLGYRADEYIGRHIATFHADPAVIDDILARLARGETLRDHEARMRAKSGEIRIVQISSNVKRQDGEFVTTRCFCRDVTEAKQAERCAELLYSVTSALSRTMSSDEAARIVIREARALVGAHAGEVLMMNGARTSIDRLIIDGHHAPGNATKLDGVQLEADLPICEAARTGHIVWIVGADAIRGRYPHLAAARDAAQVRTWGAVPIKYEDRSRGAIGFECAHERPLIREEEELLLAVGRQYGQAIERAQLHEATQIAHAEAEQASRAKDEFLAILGHELRNPLSPILTAVQLMRLRGEVSSAREQNVIERQVTHLIHIVDDLLDISRVARGKIQLERRPLKLSAVVAKALEITGPLYEERRHRLIVTMPDDDIWLEADETRLCQVFTNLLSNAAKYTPIGGLIDLSVRRQGKRVKICLRDNGDGIAPDLLPRIFGLFVQGTRTTDKAGLGIGLALVRNLVRMHGGTVTAGSEGIGRGSEFSVELPLIDVHREPQPMSDADRNLRDRVQMAPRRILVVDDNEDAGTLLGEMLRSVGHEVVVALDGPRALEAVKHFHPDVAILDIGLPVMDGHELASALRDRFGSSVRLLAVTGYGQEQDRARTAQSGFQAHFVKPVAIQKVLAAIEVMTTRTIPS
jgi:PAS domain S-box-containing protein